MPSRAQDRNPGLDALRAIAIFLVMARHYPPAMAPIWLVPAARFGWSGVDLFFVLSGFLITGQLLRRMSFAEFYLRRTLRILPLYWIALLLYFAVPGFREQSGISPLWKFVFFVQNIALDPARQPAFSHAWSLCIEEHFYLLLCPLLLVGHARIHERGFLSLLAGLLVGEVLLRLALWSPELAADRDRYLTWIYYPTPTHLDGLIIGAAVAVLETRGALDGASPRLMLGAALVVLALAAWITYDRQSLVAVGFGFLVVSIGYGLLVVAVLVGAPARGARVANLLAWLAYPAYLIHKPILQAGATLTASKQLNVALAFALVLACAYALHVVVERPMLLLREHLVTRLHGPGRSR